MESLVRQKEKKKWEQEEATQGSVALEPGDFAAVKPLTKKHKVEKVHIDESKSVDRDGETVKFSMSDLKPNFPRVTQRQLCCEEVGYICI